MHWNCNNLQYNWNDLQYSWLLYVLVLHWLSFTYHHAAALFMPLVGNLSASKICLFTKLPFIYIYIQIIYNFQHSSLTFHALKADTLKLSCKRHIYVISNTWSHPIFPPPTPSFTQNTVSCYTCLQCIPQTWISGLVISSLHAPPPPPPRPCMF